MVFGTPAGSSLLGNVQLSQIIVYKLCSKVSNNTVDQWCETSLDGTTLLTYPTTRGRRSSDHHLSNFSLVEFLFLYYLTEIGKLVELNQEPSALGPHGGRSWECTCLTTERSPFGVFLWNTNLKDPYRHFWKSEGWGHGDGITHERNICPLMIQ